MKYIVLITGISNRLRNDEELMTKFVKTYGRTIQYVSEKLRNDKQFILKCVSVTKDPTLIIEHLSQEQMSDKQFVLDCLKITQCHEILKYANKCIYNNMRTMLEAFEINMHSYKYASKRVKTLIEKRKHEDYYYENNCVIKKQKIQ